ncbi:MAG: sensor histidine kinase [Anaerolineae bacterium]
MDDCVPSEEQLLHLQRLAAAGQLSAAYAHEINNLLTGVLGYASLVRRMVADRPAVASDVDRIREQAERIAQLVRHLLDLSRRGSSTREQVDLSMVVDRVLGLRERPLKRANIEIVRTYSETIPRVEAVPEEIEQVVLNILNNAVQAMPKGGRLEVHLTVDEGAGQVCLEVRDTGCGIPPEALPRVFEPFFTTKPRGQGTGLGLYVSRCIVERHGGSMAIQSEVGVGTVVQVFLPLARPEASRAARAREAEEEEHWLLQEVEKGFGSEEI